MLLEPHHRRTVEDACLDHCEHRGWHLFCVAARSNHVYVVVSAGELPQKVRDQLKANCTRALRQESIPLIANRTWTGPKVETVRFSIPMPILKLPLFTRLKHKIEKGLNRTSVSVTTGPASITPRPAASAVGSQGNTL